VPFPVRVFSIQVVAGERCCARYWRSDECVRRYVIRGGGQVCYFFGYGKDAGFAGDEQEAVVGLAAEPAGPLEAAIVERTIEAVAGQGFGNESG
jgi:hypothetical protein